MSKATYLNRCGYSGMQYLINHVSWKRLVEQNHDMFIVVIIMSFNTDKVYPQALTHFLIGDSILALPAASLNAHFLNLQRILRQFYLRVGYILISRDDRGGPTEWGLRHVTEMHRGLNANSSFKCYFLSINFENAVI
ncbi:uncharacterized protein LOC122623742 [Drosophila teissieri]|uniref:uncharacterized protein LOC122623742 n=1 Tax=Drosophila teissieri TaxID=7243 RepID=UPI001CBA5D5E|nr:uncharacterized protein LOC122623742 [Drosophila teissieri]